MRKIENPEVRAERRNNIISTLKSMIFPTILLIIILVGVYVIMNFQNAVETEPIIPVEAYDGEGTAIVIENDELKLTMDSKTTQFEILVKDSGVVWKSNPDNIDDDGKALTAEKNRLKSLLYLSYSTQTGLNTCYDAYSYSVANGIYNISSDEDSITIDYSLGKVAKTFVIPTVLTETNYRKWYDLMPLADSNLLSSYYKKYDINNLTKKDDKEALLQSYPILETEVIYVLRDTTKDGMKKTLQRCFADVGYTYEDFVADKELDQSQAKDASLVFNVQLKLRIEDDDLIVEVPFDELQYNPKYPIYTMSILPYFGAAGTDEEGYIFVPEGGGATINFNNGRTAQSAYTARIFGWDYDIKRDAVVHNTRVYFPVYGIAKNHGSFICMMEDGASYAELQADISGKLNSYNYVNALYYIAQREQFDVGKIANSDVFKYSTPAAGEKISMRYSFVDSDSYVDMAKNYQGYLKNNYPGYFTENADSSTPVAVEIVGAIDKVKQILGMPVSRPLELTNFDEASELITDLHDLGMNNLFVKLSGWCNGGVKQQVLNNVNVLSELGGKKGLKNLSETAANTNTKLYLNGITQYAYDSNIFDGFFSYRDAAKLISKERATLHIYSHITYAERESEDPYYLLHPSYITKNVNNLVSAAKTYNAGVSFEDMGMDLSSDFYVKNTVSRDAAMKDHEQKLKNINDSGEPIMINMGNSYAMPYADMITNMDLRGSRYAILDHAVPFYQLAIHGYVDYTGFPINISGNDSEAVLIAAEYGSGLFFTLMKESPFTLQKTLYPQYYGSDFDAWRDRMADIYNRYNSEMGHLFNQEMVNHKQISDDVSMTEYADGTKVYVNYGYQDVTVAGHTLGARDYMVVK